MQKFKFSLSSPPTNEQFEAIARELLAHLNTRVTVGFEATDMYVESKSWVTMKIRSKLAHEYLIGIVFVGIISYSLRETTPSIQSVLLPFSHGKRLRSGKNSILVADFIPNNMNGEWKSFEWSFDGFGEWECDDLPS